MKIEIDVPDEVIEKIEHMMELGILSKIPLERFLTECVVENTQSYLDSAGAILQYGNPQ